LVNQISQCASGKSISVFPARQDKIYCVVYISSPQPVTLKANWYANNKLIRTDSMSVKDFGVFFIERDENGLFPEGKYRIDIYLYDFSEPVKTIEFTINKN
jgi:hypothetical protein